VTDWTAGAPCPCLLSYRVRAAAGIVRDAGSCACAGGGGVKVTFIVQFAPAASELPQVVVWRKVAGMVPVAPGS